MTAKPKPKTHTPGPALRFVAAALIVRDREVLIGQRRADQPMALLWEFPGGKIEPGESPQEALARELVEELGIRAEVGPAVTRIRHNYRGGGAVDLQFFAVRELCGRHRQPDLPAGALGEAGGIDRTTNFWPRIAG